MLGFIFSARYPAIVKKLILVGNGVYEEQYATGIMETRLNRLSKGEKREALSLCMERSQGVQVERKIIGTWETHPMPSSGDPRRL